MSRTWRWVFAITIAAIVVLVLGVVVASHLIRSTSDQAPPSEPPSAAPIPSASPELVVRVGAAVESAHRSAQQGAWIAAPDYQLLSVAMQWAAASAPSADPYRRAEFGNGWPDVDGNGCDTRNDILTRDLLDITVDDRCRVLTGRLADPYSGTVVDFVRGEFTSSAVQIDHVVALEDAWHAGAAAWTTEERRRFANDPAELMAVDGPTNQAKGNGTPATWRPPNDKFVCQYVARYAAIVAHYSLALDDRVRRALIDQLVTCAEESVLR